jgi:hypothetical protein
MEEKETIEKPGDSSEVAETPASVSSEIPA